MIEDTTGMLEQYTGSLTDSIQKEYLIDEKFYQGDVKRGLRNSDGTGVLVGVTKVGSVQGYFMQDGQRVPAPGKLYYRGIELTEIVEAHRKADTFGFEEVAYLLLMGYLPTRGELNHFNDIMNRARKLPDGFTEGMIMRHPSRNIMNELERSILSLYSYDPEPDNIEIDNILMQSVRLIGYFPSIIANAYAVKRHYFDGDSLHIHFPVENLSTAENFLRMMRPDKSYTDETVVLLSKGEVDSKKIRVEFSLEDMDMSEFQDGATYPQIKEYVLEHTGLKVSNLYISQIKRKCGIGVGKNYNLPKSEDSRQPQCPQEKEKAIREAFKYFGMI